jgi:hypothetical protein
VEKDGQNIYNLNIKKIMKNQIKSKCEHCGASLQVYNHTLSSGLVSALIKSIQFVQENKKNEFHLQNDLKNLTKNEYNNFQKLRFHGLVAKIENKAGYWLITRRGGLFLRGEIGIPHNVQTFRNKVVGHSGDITTINQFRGKVPEFQKNFECEWDREETLSTLCFKI